MYWNKQNRNKNKQQKKQKQKQKQTKNKAGTNKTERDLSFYCFNQILSEHLPSKGWVTAVRIRTIYTQLSFTYHVSYIMVLLIFGQLLGPIKLYYTAEYYSVDSRNVCQGILGQTFSRANPRREVIQAPHPFYLNLKNSPPKVTSPDHSAGPVPWSHAFSQHTTGCPQVT